MVPEDVMGPPTRPAPVATEVTVPVDVLAGEVFVIVRLPATPEMEMPGPGVREMTPVFVT
jgi:hypothetical protein